MKKCCRGAIRLVPGGGGCDLDHGLFHCGSKDGGGCGPCGGRHPLRGLDHAREINRIVTDSLTNLFFTTSVTANENLRKCGVDEACIFFVGNTMIDTLLKQMPRFRKPEIWDRARLEAGDYIVLTLHRPANVDEEDKLKAMMEAIIRHTRGLPLVFPVHPRTAMVLEKLGIDGATLLITEPLGYLEFNYLVKHA